MLEIIRMRKVEVRIMIVIAHDESNHPKGTKFLEKDSV